MALQKLLCVCVVCCVFSDEEAVKLIQMEPPQKKRSGPVVRDEGSIQHCHYCALSIRICPMCVCS